MNPGKLLNLAISGLWPFCGSGNAAAEPSLKSAVVKPYKGKMAIFVNGTPQLPRFYNFGIGDGLPGWWGGPVTMRTIASEKKLLDRAMSRPRKSAADVLVVWDTMTFLTRCTPTRCLCSGKVLLKAPDPLS